jgi:hypothetical protein
MVFSRPETFGGLRGEHQFRLDAWVKRIDSLANPVRKETGDASQGRPVAGWLMASPGLKTRPD